MMNSDTATHIPCIYTRKVPLCEASETREGLLTSLGSTSHTAASLLYQASLELQRAWDAQPSRAAAAHTHTHSTPPAIAAQITSSHLTWALCAF